MSCAVEGHDWEKSYKAKFHIEGLKQKGMYMLSVESRVDRTYPCKDLWLVVETKNRGELLTDTVTMDIVDADGIMKGKGLNILEYALPVRSMSLASTDTLDICVSHIMTHRPLPGVHDVGILLAPMSE